MIQEGTFRSEMSKTVAGKPIDESKFHKATMMVPITTSTKDILAWSFDKFANYF